MADHRHPVVVGVDGGVESATALRWAIAEARRRHRPLRLVHAYRHHPSPTSGRGVAISPLGRGVPVDPGVAVDEGVAFDADHLVRDTVAEARELDPDLAVTGCAIAGHGGEVLVAESGRADVLVVGARRLGELAGALLGSVSSVVVARARCPVVVVRSNGAEPGRPGLVVVGVDDPDASEGVLGFGFAYADRASALLRAVLCRPLRAGRPPRGRTGTPTPVLPEAALQRWRRAFPRVPVEERIVAGPPVPVLVEEADHADLLVVGGRREDGRDLGAVSQGVLRHARCPVAVVPPT